MSCLGNGGPIGPVLGRIYLQDICIDSQGDSIDINYQAQHELELEQVTTHWASPVITSDNLIFAKNNTVVTAVSTIFIQFDPSVGPVFDWWNVTPFRWRKGDYVRLYYQNIDDVGIGSEIILRIVG